MWRLSWKGLLRMLAGWLSGTRYRWHQVLVVLEMVMPNLVCLFMANMVVWVVLTVVRADIVMVVIVSQIDLHIDQVSSEKD